MKILITGGNGFIARNLFEQLNSDYTHYQSLSRFHTSGSASWRTGVSKTYNVIPLDSHQLNLLDSQKVFNYLKSNKFDVVIHTATYDASPKHSIKDPRKVLENNLKMFFNIVRGKDYFGKMIYFGSGAEFGREHWIPKMKEDYFDTHVPNDQYGFSKYIMTKYTQVSSNIYNLRLFGVFGKYDDWRTRFIPNACCNAILNRPIRINQNRFFDFIYIDDLIKIVRWFIGHKPKKKIYNVCTGQVNDFKSIARKIVKISGKKLKITINTEGLGKEYSGDNTRLMNEIKGLKFSLIDESIKALYDWFILKQTSSFLST